MKRLFVLFALLLSSVANAALTCSHLTEGIDVAGGPTATSSSISPASNSTLVVAVRAFDSATMSVSGAGLTWTAVINGVNGGDDGFGSSRLWVFVGAGASPSSGALTLTYDTDGFVNWSVDQILGANIAGPTTANAQSATGVASTSPAVTLGAFSDAENGVWAYGYGTDSAAATAGSGFSLVDFNDGTAMFGHSDFSECQDANDTSPDATWSQPVNWVFAALEIVDAAGGGGSLIVNPISGRGGAAAQPVIAN